MVSSNTGDLLKSCAGIMGVYAILFQVIERTRMIEKVSALTFYWWELLIITAFVATRLAIYLLVPPTLLALGTWKLARELNRKQSKKSSI